MKKNLSKLAVLTMALMLLVLVPAASLADTAALPKWMQPKAGERVEQITLKGKERPENETAAAAAKPEDRKVSIYFDLGADNKAAYGDFVTICSKLEGYGGLTYTLQWQYTIDGNTWKNVKGANESTYTYRLTMANGSYNWRLLVTTND